MAVIMLKDKEGKSLYGQLSDCAVVLGGQVAFGRKTKKCFFKEFKSIGLKITIIAYMIMIFQAKTHYFKISLKLDIGFCL